MFEYMPSLGSTIVMSCMKMDELTRKYQLFYHIQRAYLVRSSTKTVLTNLTRAFLNTWLQHALVRFIHRSDVFEGGWTNEVYLHTSLRGRRHVVVVCAADKAISFQMWCVAWELDLHVVSVRKSIPMFHVYNDSLKPFFRYNFETTLIRLWPECSMPSLGLSTEVMFSKVDGLTRKNRLWPECLPLGCLCHVSNQLQNFYITVDSLK